MMRALGVALSLSALAMPALAQSDLSATPPGVESRLDGWRSEGLRLRDAFARLSPEGQRVMLDQQRQQRAADRTSRAAVEQVRRRMLELWAAERLDMTALRRLQGEERALLAEAQQQRQEAMASALQKLSAQDRRTFATELLRIQERARQRREAWEQRLEQRLRKHGIAAGGEPLLPPPPPDE